MGLPATVFQGIQIGVESTAGEAVAANKKLLSTSITPVPKVETKPFRAMGNKYASFSTLNKEWAGLNIEGAPTYNEIVYLLSSLLHYCRARAARDNRCLQMDVRVEYVCL